MARLMGIRVRVSYWTIAIFSIFLIAYGAQRFSYQKEIEAKNKQIQQLQTEIAEYKNKQTQERIKNLKEV